VANQSAATSDRELWANFVASRTMLDCSGSVAGVGSSAASGLVPMVIPLTG